MSSQVSISVEKKSITELLDELKSGKYFLPSFQRKYVWDADDIKNLIDSIVKNYPIGAVIIWKKHVGTQTDPFSTPLVDVDTSDHKEIY